MSGKNNFRNFILLSIGLLALTIHSAKAEDFYFKRQPGLWEINTESNGRAIPPIKQCIDEATDKEMQAMGNEMSKNCKKKEMNKSGDTYTMDSECNFSGTTISSHGTFKGDFTSSYQGEFTSTYNPPMMGKKNGSTKISAKWLGECTAGMQAGDMIMPGGMKMNINQLKKSAAMMKREDGK